MGNGWVGVNTARPNQVMAEAIAQSRIPQLAGYRRLQREVGVMVPGLERSRLDIALGNGNGTAEPEVFVEVKNVTLLAGAALRFPDARTERGRKHLDLLAALVASGRRAVMLFALNRPEGRFFEPARDIDPVYAERLSAVRDAGVEVLAIRMRHGPDHIVSGESIPVVLSAGAG
jgi:sugar fermentation stimulation protein A